MHRLLKLNHNLSMNIRNSLFSCFILPLVFLASQNATAGKVYQWTDEEGVVHYSDVLPAGDTTITDTREINIDIYADDNVDPDRYSVINQADRMAERRRKVTEERLAKKRLQLEEKRLALAQEQIQQNEVYSEQGRYQSVYYPTYQQPYYFYQPRLAHHQRNAHHQRSVHHQRRHAHRSSIAHGGKFSAGHRGLGRFNNHHSTVSIRF